MIIANGESDNVLTYAGKHGKLGELIGKTVMAAVKESLHLHMGLSAKSQHSIGARLKRYQVAEKAFCDKLDQFPDVNMAKADFVHQLHLLDGNKEMVIYTSLFVHLLDQLQWGLLSLNETVIGGEMILGQIAATYSIEWQAQEGSWTEPEACIDFMLDRFVTIVTMVAIALNKN